MTDNHLGLEWNAPSRRGSWILGTRNTTVCKTRMVSADLVHPLPPRE